MIRDPSDGSVRTADHQPKPLEEKKNAPESDLLNTTSGLPETSSRSDYLARLQRSREWLSQYRKKETA